jgi:hypothetical protein
LIRSTAFASADWPATKDYTNYTFLFAKKNIIEDAKSKEKSAATPDSINFRIETNAEGAVGCTRWIDR